jgi:uncharacterized LabA/DUF88 family protein
MSRIAIFIDGGYWHKIIRNHFHGAQIDYAKLAQIIAGDQEILRTYFYDCLPFQENPPTEEQKTFHSKRQRFLTALKYIPRFEIRLGKLVRREVHFLADEAVSGGWRLATEDEIEGGVSHFVTKYEQKGIDLLLGTDLVKLAAKGSISTAVLIAGDHDFVTPVRSAKDEGILVRLYYYPATVSDELFTLCDDKIKIGQEFIDLVTR